MKSFVRLFVFVVLLGSFGLTARAEEMAPAAADQAAADKAAMMEKMKAASTPGAEHKVLEQLAGKWTAATKFWMDPSAPAEESTGTADAEIVFGGRFLKETYTGTAHGQPFEGVGYTGYDNVKKQYVGNWVDSMATGIMNSTGTYDAASNTLKMGGTMSCPINGDMKMRMETVITDNDHHTMTGYMTGADGKEAKGMEIVYTRAQ